MRTKLALAALALAACLSASPARAAEPATWSSRVKAATRYSEERAGVVSFAVVDERGRLHGYRANAVAHSASVLKAMLLVAYLRKADVRARPLRRWERELLGPMIRRSDNAAASAVLGLVGSAGVYAVARLADMRNFRLSSPIWGLSEITARDQARFFYRIDSYVPARHRAHALRLLATIVASQRWGVARAAPSGWRLYFKGGWGSGTGLVDHQVALLRVGGERVSLAILTRLNPDHDYGKETLRGVAARLLHRIPRPLFATAPAARFAFDAGYLASLDSRCGRLRIRSLTGERVAVPTAAPACSSVRLALAGTRALWSWPKADFTHVATAALDDPLPEEVAMLGADEVLRALAGGGTTLVFAHDSYEPDGSFAGGAVTDSDGDSCAAPEHAAVAAAAGRIAVGSGETIEVRALATCELVAALTAGGTISAVALGRDLLAALVRASDGSTRVERYRVSTATRLGATRVASSVAPRLDVARGWVVYRVGHRLVALAAGSGRKWAIWRPRQDPLGLALSGRRAGWMENFAGRGRAWLVRLPRV
jgi:hypothetical protein